MQQLDYNLLYGWFVRRSPDDEAWTPTVFSKNRNRLLDGEIAEVFFREVLALADAHHCLPHEHFAVDGTMLEAWASHKTSADRRAPAAVG